MSVHHEGYCGDGIEEYEARRWFPSNTPLSELTDCVGELRRELFSHREGMEVEGSAKARVSVSPTKSDLVVSIRGFWVDREARTLEREGHGRRGED